MVGVDEYGADEDSAGEDGAGDVDVEGRHNKFLKISNNGIFKAQIYPQKNSYATPAQKTKKKVLLQLYLWL